MNRKGLFNEIYLIVILAVVLVTLIIIIWGASMLVPIAVGEGQVLTSAIRDSINLNAPNSGLANASNVATSTVTGVLGVVESIFYLCFLGGIIGFIAVCYYARTYKWLALAWIGIIIGAVFIAMIVSNAYEMASNSSADINSFYKTWGTNDFMMSNLPVIVALLGIVSGIILFAIVATSEETTEEIM